MITLVEYFGPYINHPDKTDQVWDNAKELLERCNTVYELAEADGCYLLINPKTNSGVSGKTEGGFRTQDSTTGATNSAHKTGKAVDRYDPARQFASWCMANLDILKYHILWMEDPRWTPGWVHLQSIPPRSGNRVFIPSNTKPLVDWPEKWD